MLNVSIIGAGNFGFALTYHLDRKNDPDLNLSLYDHNPATIQHLRETRLHPKYFPTTELSERVHIVDNYPTALQDCEVLILAVVSTALEDVLAQIKPLITKPLQIVSIMKALDNDTGQPLTTIIEQKLADLPVKIAALAGGTTGLALTQEQYLGATLACADDSCHPALKNLFQSPYLQIQVSHDLLGVEYASSFKNLISVVVGILKGLGFNYGTQTHALSLMATECKNLALQFGAKESTFDFSSQCWGNDMVMSATSSETRNHQLGLLLGEGHPFEQAVAQMKAEKKTAESVNTLAILPQIADLSQFPLLQFLTQLSRGEVAAHQIVKVIETYS